MTVLIVQGHVMDMLRRIDDESVHCVVTSPPYYGLRSYGTEPQMWGGDWDHNHDDSEICRCGRWVGHLGLEPTPELFIQHLVEIFREVRRVLRKDGTLWLNIGDSYAAGKTGRDDSGDRGGARFHGQPAHAGHKPSQRKPPTGTKPKDLLMIPSQLALALRADGWWLRSEIVWAKKAPMPESCTDRPTCAHEKVFLLTKSARYFYDQDAVRDEPTGRTDPISSFGKPGTPRQDGTRSYQLDGSVGRNMRNVWHLGPKPFPEAHFATYPPGIPRRAILAGTSAKGVCPKCGAPWVRETKVIGGVRGRIIDTHADDAVKGNTHGASTYHGATRAEYESQKVETIGWRPSCSCDAGEPIPGMVLDCFLGSGTTALVADQLGRDCIGIELSPQYAAMAALETTRGCSLLLRPSE
ncbi:MAG TPA: site-specific DNA-methyltransferase [Candidatus Sulfotelmatobacter sp.]|jgi:DNA modification methylase